MTSHRNKDEQKVLLQTRVSECLAQEIREYSENILSEKNMSWAVRNILKNWAESNDTVQNHSS